MIASYIYGDNSGRPEAKATGQAMAISNIMELLSGINDRLAEIGGIFEDKMTGKL